LCFGQEEDEFDSVAHHLHDLFELVHVNVWGPTKTASLRGD